MRAQYFLVARGRRDDLVNFMLDLKNKEMFPKSECFTTPSIFKSDFYPDKEIEVVVFKGEGDFRMIDNLRRAAEGREVDYEVVFTMFNISKEIYSSFIKGLTEDKEKEIDIEYSSAINHYEIHGGYSNKDFKLLCHQV